MEFMHTGINHTSLKTIENVSFIQELPTFEIFRMLFARA